MLPGMDFYYLCIFTSESLKLVHPSICWIQVSDENMD